MRGFVLCLCFNMQLFCFVLLQEVATNKVYHVKLGSGRAYFRIVLTTGYTPLFTLHGANVQASRAVLTLTTRWRLATVKQRRDSRACGVMSD